MTSKLRYVIVEDEELDRATIQVLAGRHSFLECAGTSSDALAGIDLIHSVKPDVVFMDVEMPGASGIDVLRATKGQVPVNVLITSHPEFALEGFELDVLDYVLKPLTPERFDHTARRIQEFWEMREKAIAYSVLFEKETLTIKEGHYKIKVPLPEIIYLEAMNNYTKIVTGDKRHLVLATLSNFMDQLPAAKFRRIHRSYVVAFDKVKELRGAEILIGSHTLPVGKTYRQSVGQWDI